MNHCNSIDRNFSSFLSDELKNLHERVVKYHQQVLASDGCETKIATSQSTHPWHPQPYTSLKSPPTRSELLPLCPTADSYAPTPLNSLKDSLSRDSSKVEPTESEDWRAVNTVPALPSSSAVSHTSVATSVSSSQRRGRRATTASAILSSIVWKTFGTKPTEPTLSEEEDADEICSNAPDSPQTKRTKFDVLFPVDSTHNGPLAEQRFPISEPRSPIPPSFISTPGCIGEQANSDKPRDTDTDKEPALVLDGNSKMGELAVAQLRRLRSRASTRTGTRKNTVGRNNFVSMQIHKEWRPSEEADKDSAEKESEHRLKLFKSSQEVPRIQIQKRDGLRDSVAHTIRQESIIDAESEKAKKASKRLSLHSVEEIQSLRSRTLFGASNLRFISRLCYYLITEPTTRCRICWDFCGLFLLGYDIVIIPLQVFDLGTTTLLTVMQWVVLLYWSSDIIASFFVGYHREGIIEIRPGRIATRYFRSWFLVDTTLVLVDITIMAIGNSEGNDPSGIARLGKSFRALRILRAIRLVRLAKLPKILDQIQEQVQSEYLIVMISITKLTAFLLASNHFIACAWYFIGIQSESQDSWIKVYSIEQKAGAYRYATSLHWSLTQFTPASMEVFPQNLAERLFCVVVLVFAMVTFSSFVSSITNAMTSLRNMNVDASKQQALLQKYLRLNKINLSLSVRVRRHIEFVMGERQSQLREDEVPLLGHLMEPLKIELHYEVYAHVLKAHPFFHSMDAISSRVMERICHKAVSEKYTLPGDRIFTSADAAEHMYISMSEGLRYQIHEGTESSHPAPLNVIDKDQWLCEIVLWSSWMHKGDCWGEAYCHTILVHSGNFRDAVKGASYARSIMSHYACLYVDHAKRFIDTITDLHPFDFNLERAICVALFEDVDSDTDSESNHSSSALPPEAPEKEQKERPIISPSGSWIAKNKRQKTNPKDGQKYSSNCSSAAPP